MFVQFTQNGKAVHFRIEWIKEKGLRSVQEGPKGGSELHFDKTVSPGALWPLKLYLDEPVATVLAELQKLSVEPQVEK